MSAEIIPFAEASAAARRRRAALHQRRFRPADLFWLPLLMWPPVAIVAALMMGQAAVAALARRGRDA